MFVQLESTAQIDWQETDVLIIGDKPNVAEKLVDAMEDLAKAALEKFRMRKKSVKKSDPDVVVSITNNEDKAQRVILGDGVTDYTINPGETYKATGRDYLEIRTLGNAPQQGGTPD